MHFEKGTISSASFLQLLESIPVATLLVNRRGEISYANSEAESLLGFEPQALINKSIETIIPERFHIKHSRYLSTYFDAPAKRKMGFGQTLYAVRNDGKEIPVEIGLNPFDLDSNSSVVVSLVDLSVRQEATRILINSVALAPYGVLLIGQNGKIMHVNEALCKSFGYIESEMIGMSVESLLPERYRQHHKSLRASYSQTPVMRTMGEGRDLTALHKDGREFPVEIGLSPIDVGPEGRIILVSLTDITKRTRLEMALKETNKNLEEFTYVASHDLRSPLRGISDLLTWIQEDIDLDANPEVAKNLNRIAIRIDKMEQLIANLLTYARAGRASTALEEVDVRHLIDEVIDFVDAPTSFKIECIAESVTLSLVLTPLETILRNLLSNAIKHHDKEQGNIHVSCELEGNFCIFKVKDDGPGIAPSAMKRIFNLFQTATASERGGTGIGLSVSRRLAEVHGANLSVTSNEPDEGVTFELRWPRFVRKDTHDLKA
ncbi:sensor histidine kinase [Pseudoalteromonas xiamenensis]